MAPFVPRQVFTNLQSIPRSYYLGHHRSGLAKMKTMLSRIDLIIECRDYRVPISSRNPLFEENLLGRNRLVVYTKKDLGRSEYNDTSKLNEDIIRQWHQPTPVLFTDHQEQRDVKQILRMIRSYTTASSSLTGSQVIVVGMPNVGKSSLLNALRRNGVSKGKVASTGAQPGVTRKIGTSVKILEGQQDQEGVYILDTPGVFMPYVSDPEAMLKLALCGSVKDNLIPAQTLADYLLFHMNLSDPSVYSAYHEPTNDVVTLLSAISKETGRLQKGAVEDIEGSALWFVQRWRKGVLGKLVLDSVSESSFTDYDEATRGLGGSISSARQLARRELRARNLSNISR